MKFIERILLFAILLVAAAIVVNGFLEYPLHEEAPAAEISIIVEKAADSSGEEKPLESFFKTPADDLKDPLTEVVFIAKDELTMQKSLADLQRLLPPDKHESVLEFFKSKHKIASGQSESGELELRYPSLLVLKAYDGKNVKEILEFIRQ